jgi:hypothetical protein
MSHSSFLFTNKQYDKNNEMTNNWFLNITIGSSLIIH